MVGDEAGVVRSDRKGRRRAMSATVPSPTLDAGAGRDRSVSVPARHAIILSTVHGKLE